MSDLDEKELIRKVKALQKKPAKYITGILGEDSLEVYHEDICEAVVEFDRIAIKACHAVGKTWICGRLVPWFISCFKNSIVITTAPTNRQVETLLWGEIRKAHRRSKTRLGGKMLQKKWTIDDDWYAMGFSPSTSAQSDGEEQQGSSFQGFHAKHVMVVFDEATGIPRDLYTMAEGLLTSGVTVKWICIANPTSTSSEFFKICKKADWHVMTINCYNSPNMIANGFTDRESLEKEIDYLRTLSDYERLKRIKNYDKPNGYLLSAQWAIAKLYGWGFDHPLSKSKILGEFPDSSDDVIIKYDSVQAAFNREPSFDYEKRYIGVDVARYGDDLTVLTEITDVTVREKIVLHHKDTVETTGHVVKLYDMGNQHKETHIVIDATGIGSGVVDNLREMKREGKLPKNCFIHEMHFANKIRLSNAPESEKSPQLKKKEKQLNDTYENVKAYMFDLLNKDLKDHLYLPTEEVYEEELPSIMFKYSKRGRLVVEPKDEYKKRVGKSPDTADSLALANYARYMKPTHQPFVNKKAGPKPYHRNFDDNPKATKQRKIRIKVKEY